MLRNIAIFKKMRNKITPENVVKFWMGTGTIGGICGGVIGAIGDDDEKKRGMGIVIIDTMGMFSAGALFGMTSFIWIPIVVPICTFKKLRKFQMELRK